MAALRLASPPLLQLKSIFCFLPRAGISRSSIVYTRAAGGFFSKENKVILSTADSPEGAQIAVAEYFPTRGPLFKIWQTSSVLSAEKERKGPAEEVLQAYTAHMKEILKKNGLLK